jgi:uncharacterized RDD family membrane protein YckC
MVSALDLIGRDTQLQSHWIRRIIAIIIDFIIVIVIFGLWDFLFLPFYMGIIWLLYTIILEGLHGATLGKRFLNLRVISLEGPMDIVKSLIRNISKIHGLLLLLDWIVGFVSHGDPRQRFLDRIAKTTVERIDQGEHFPGAIQAPPKRGYGIPVRR